MVIINKTSSTKYSGLADRDIGPSARSSEIDAGGLAEAMSKVVRGCGNSFCIRLNDTERKLLDRIVELDGAGTATKIAARPQQPNPLQELMKREAAENAKKIASIRKARAREDGIRDEANYTSRKDIEEAKARAGIIKGDVEAKKLDRSEKAPSLSDLMSDNKFIEESMKHSGISTVVASEEGWDMEKMNEPKAKPEQEAGEKAEEPAPAPAEAEKPEKTTKARRPRRRNKESEQ